MVLQVQTALFVLSNFCQSIPNYKGAVVLPQSRTNFCPATKLSDFTTCRRYSDSFNCQSTFNVINTCGYQIFWSFQVRTWLPNSKFGEDEICGHFLQSQTKCCQPSAYGTERHKNMQSTRTWTHCSVESFITTSLLYGFSLCFCRSVIGPWPLQENNAVELASQSSRYICYKHKPYNKVGLVIGRAVIKRSFLSQSRFQCHYTKSSSKEF